MTSGSQLISPFKGTQYSLRNNEKILAIKQPSILEIQILYEAIRGNIKIVNNLFTDANKH